MSAPDTRFWFKPKSHGYGATPSNWKGWAATTAFSLALGIASVATMLALKDTGSILAYLVWFLAVLAAVYGFTQFARARTDGDWAWRWKGQKYVDIYDPEKQQNCNKS
ncbi:MAG: hypothetical protein KDJ37_06500 [Hyphomicrobiaceae bacterium]|nr:hypothetical protein [Hyphomicrobiaceae bacterium]